MTKRIKLIAIVLSVVIMVALVGSIGATAAIWTSASSGGNSEVGPTATSTNWNVWAKYFTCSDGVLTGFHFAIEDPTNSDSFNHNRLTIPNTWGETPEESTVVNTISGGLFEASVMKEMTEELEIPKSIKTINASAFSGFVNLKKITFQEGSELAPLNCVIGVGAFSGTLKLQEIYVGTIKLSELTPDYSSGEIVYKVGDYSTLTFSPLALFGSAFIPKTA